MRAYVEDDRRFPPSQSRQGDARIVADSISHGSSDDFVCRGRAGAQRGLHKRDRFTHYQRYPAVAGGIEEWGADSTSKGNKALSK
jgi:hypothetical protein